MTASNDTAETSTPITKGGVVNHPIIAQALATELVRDRVDRATAQRLAGDIRRTRSLRDAHDIVIREARPADAVALARLVQFGDAQTPDGRMIVAIVNGQIVAVAAGPDGLVIADPFLPTEAIVMLLEAQARQVTAGDARSLRAPRRERSESRLERRPDPTGAVA
jgi:hypothetical protein